MDNLRTSDTNSKKNSGGLVRSNEKKSISEEVSSTENRSRVGIKLYEEKKKEELKKAFEVLRNQNSSTESQDFLKIRRSSAHNGAFSREPNFVISQSQKEKFNQNLDKYFCWDQICWNHEFSNLSAAFFVLDSTNFNEDSLVDQTSLECLEKLMKSNFLFSHLSPQLLLPFSFIINKINLNPNLDKMKVIKSLETRLPNYLTNTEQFLPFLFTSSSFDKIFKHIFYNIEKSSSLLLSDLSLLIQHHFPLHLKEKSNKTEKQSITPRKEEKKEKQEKEEGENVQQVDCLVLQNIFSLKNLESFKTIDMKEMKKIELSGLKDFSKSKLFQSFVSSLTNLKVEELTLREGIMSGELLETLGKFVKNSNCKLSKLRLIEIFPNCEELLKFLQSLSHNKKLTSIDLSKNFFNRVALRNLVAICFSKNQLSEIFISNCAIEESNLDLISSHLLKYSNKLKVLDISENSNKSPLYPQFIKDCLKSISQNVSLPLSHFSCSLDNLESSLLDEIAYTLSEKRKNIARLQYSIKSFKKNKAFPLFPLLMPKCALSGLAVKHLFQSFDNQKLVERYSLKSINAFKNKNKQNAQKKKQPEDPKIDSIFKYIKNEEENLDFEGIDLSWFHLSNHQFSSYNFDFSVLGKFFDVKYLKHINLAHNQFFEIPKQIYTLSFCEQLNLSNNEIEKIGDDLSKMTLLKVLDLSNNLLRRLNPSLSTLSNLKELYLHNNNIHQLSPNLLGSLSQLEELTLHCNNLRELPNDLFEKLANLQVVTLYLNLFDQIQDEYYNIWALKKKLADFSNMQLENLSFEIYLIEHIVELNLSNNNLKYLPPHICYLKSLKKLDVRNNKLLELPPQLCDILLNLDALYLYGNDQLKVPKELTISQEKPLLHQQYEILKQYLQSYNEKEISKKSFNIHVIANHNDFQFFVKEFLAAKTIESTKRVSSNYYSNNENEIFDYEEVKKASFLLNSSSTENFEENFHEKLVEISNKKNTHLNNKVKEEGDWYKILEFEEKEIKFKVFGFEDQSIFFHYSSFFGQEIDLINVIIHNISEDLTELLSKVQTIRSTQKGPIFILGNNANEFDKKKLKDVQSEILNKISDLYSNVISVLFVTPKNSKTFFEMISKNTSRVPYSQHQFQLLLESESRLCSNFPVINYYRFEKMMKPFHFPNFKNLTYFLDQYQKDQYLLYFNTPSWGKNRIVVIDPYFIISLIRNIFNFSQTTLGIFNIYDCFSYLLSKRKIVDHSTFYIKWFSVFLRFFQQIEVVLSLKTTPHLFKQFKKEISLFRFDRQILYFVPSALPLSKYDWDTFNEISFSFFEPEKKKTLNKSQTLSKFSEREIEEIELWYSLLTFSYSLFNSLLFRILNLSEIKVVKLWGNMVLFRIGDTAFNFGFFQSKKGYDVRLKVKGNSASSYFFILNDLIQNVVSNHLKRCKFPQVELVIPLYDCVQPNSSIKLKVLEHAFFKSKLNLQCPFCNLRSYRHNLSLNEIAPFVCLYHCSNFQISHNSLSEKQKIARGAAGIIYKARLSSNNIVAVKEFLIPGTMEQKSISKVKFQELSETIQNWK